jgi:predicted enzyme related to lactoylglutathione lyase
MGKVLGIGGLFFKSDNPQALADWYAQHVGFAIAEFGGSTFAASGLPQGAYSVWSPFKADTTYFAPSPKAFMLNLIVDNVEEVMARAVAGGAQQAGGIERYEYGIFGWFVDPEGNKIELWQPPAVA